MTSVKPFQAYSKKEIEQLKQRFQGLLSAWSQQWFGRDCSRIEMIDNACVLSPEENIPPCLSADGFYIGDTKAPALLQALLQSNHASSTDVSGQIGEAEQFLLNRCFSQLASAIKQQNTRLTQEGVLDHRAFQHGAGWLVIHCQVLDHHLPCYLNASLVNTLLDNSTDVAKPSNTGLSKRSDCIQQGRLTLAASLGQVELSIGELSQLKKGDVISFAADVSGVIDVLNDEQTVVCRGALGYRDGHRALRIVKS